ncbi:MAG: histidine-type phosphatase [Novosphingobium sp.]
MKTYRALTVFLACAMAALGGPSLADDLSAGDRSGLAPGEGYRVERVVIVYRHGLRAPLDTEIGAMDYSRDRWPSWATANAQLTPHGREALRLMGRYDKALFSGLGLLQPTGCPGADSLGIYTDSDSRSIGSGDELREGLAPGCQIPVQHKAPGQPDLTFTAGAPGSAPFDAKAALASIESYTKGGPGELVAQTRPQTRVLEKILGCRSLDGSQDACDIAAVPSRLRADDRGIGLAGPIMITSGTAEVLLLQYAEGMPMSQVGWGRASLAELTEVSRLHALLFDVFDRSPYMARRTAAEMAPRIRSLLTGSEGPKVMLFVGHDNNIAALTALMGASFQMPTYGRDDPPIGGGLGFMLLTDTKTGKPFVRVFYQAQTLDQMRNLTPLSPAAPPATQILSPECAKGPAQLCALGDLAGLLTWPGQAPVPAPGQGAEAGEAVRP